MERPAENGVAAGVCGQEPVPACARDVRERGRGALEGSARERWLRSSAAVVATA